MGYSWECILEMVYHYIIILYAESAKLDTIDTTSDTDMVFKRNGTEFFKLGTGYATVDGAPTFLIVALVFLRGGYLLMLLLIEAMTQTQNLGALLVEVVDGVKKNMLYEHIPENLHFYTDVEVDEGKKLYVNNRSKRMCCS